MIPTTQNWVFMWARFMSKWVDESFWKPRRFLSPLPSSNPNLNNQMPVRPFSVFPYCGMYLWSTHGSCSIERFSGDMKVSCLQRRSRSSYHIHLSTVTQIFPLICAFALLMTDPFSCRLTDEYQEMANTYTNWLIVTWKQKLQENDVQHRSN